MEINRILAAAILVSLIASPSLAQDVVPDEEDDNAPKNEYSPYVEDDYPNRVLFGDTHLHTFWSYDAGMGGASLGPDDAYRVSRGDVVTSQGGWKVKLIKPLDFVVVADHAENLGLMDFIQRSDPILLANETGKRWHDLVKAGKRREAFRELMRGGTGKHQDLINEPRMMEAAWSNVVKNAEEYYQPGVFTTFHGFEWTSASGGNNMHRVVIFRDAGDKTSQILPYSQYDSVDAEDLWAYMAAYEEKTGGRVLAAAHNGNLSNGLMFDTKTYGGDPLTTAYAQTRARFEPIYEVTQTKGDGETHPLVSPDDQFADFETIDKGNLGGTTAKTPDMLPKEYARPALMEGLRLEEQLGANPFKFGLIGSTDNHTALPTTREENHLSKTHVSEPSEERYKAVLLPRDPPELSLKIIDFGASGLAAVWARENTREAIWDAMVRREVYATTGTRIQVRVFGGWDFEPDEVHRSDFARQGYARGVPMGGDLTNAPAGEAPTFMIRALRDADGANLDRIQVIKGWLDNNGETNEQVYNVAVSDGRRIRRNNSVSDVGNTVDIADASYTNTIGDPVLEAHWEDPDFNPQQRAFYYVRVIEIPTPRWTAYDAKFFNIDMPDDIKMEVQDRAYTSPIWYTPSSEPPPAQQQGRSTGSEFKDCDVCPTMVVVPAGRFTMGSPSNEDGRFDNEGPQHSVTISRDFAVGKFEVTFNEWDTCVADGGCNGYRPDDQGWGRGTRPVISMNWDDAQAYVSWLARETASPYRLLSEAEWEYVARAGTTSAFPWGDIASHEYANYGADECCAGLASGRDQWVEPAPVGSFETNAFGLYDMHGNVWEWTEDCWNDSYDGAPSDGSAWLRGECDIRVLRGGSGGTDPKGLRSANRYVDGTGDRFFSFGFRVARTLN